MQRIIFGFPFELLVEIPEFGPRMAEIQRLLAEDAARYEGALPSRTDLGSEVFNYTPMNQGFLSRKVLQEQGYQLLVEDSERFVWIGDELEMTEALPEGKSDVQRFRKATESLYIATSIDNWYDMPVEGEFFVKTVIVLD